MVNNGLDTRRTLDGDGNLTIGSFGASVTLGVILFVRSALCLLCFFIFSNHFSESVVAGSILAWVSAFDCQRPFTV